jgi:hypothetical protein
MDLTQEEDSFIRSSGNEVEGVASMHPAVHMLHEFSLRITWRKSVILL